MTVNWSKSKRISCRNCAKKTSAHQRGWCGRHFTSKQRFALKHFRSAPQFRSTNQRAQNLVTSGQYSFCLQLNADWLIQISEGLAVCKDIYPYRESNGTKTQRNRSQSLQKPQWRQVNRQRSSGKDFFIDNPFVFLNWRKTRFSHTNPYNFAVA